MSDESIEDLKRKLPPELQEFVELASSEIDRAMERHRPSRRPMPSQEDIDALMARSQEKRRREDILGRQVHTLADSLTNSDKSLNEKNTELLQPCIAGCPHAIFEELLSLDVEDALRDLQAWELELSHSTFLDDVKRYRVRLLVFDAFVAADTGLGVGVTGFQEGNLDEGYGRTWPQPRCRTLSQFQNIVSPYTDTKEFPLAVDVAERQLLPAFLCLLLNEFLSCSKYLVPLCREPLEVRMLFFNVTWYPIGTIADGHFAANPQPLRSAFT